MNSKVIFVFLKIYTIYVGFLALIVFLTHFILGNIVSIFVRKNKGAILAWIAKYLVRAFFIVSGIKVTVLNKERFPKDFNCVIVGNHQSLLDIFVLIAFLPTRLIFFAKQELAKVPILNWGLVNMEHVFVNREQASKALEQLEKMEIKLEKNLNVFIFPEGTRTHTGKMTPFKRGAFHLAAKMKKPIVPCYINGTFKILNKDKLVVKPGNITLAIGDVITDDFNDSIKVVSKRLQDKANNCVMDFENKLYKS